jgi:hypothetical protein
MRWIIEHKNDAKIAELLSRTELWFMPIQNPDGYDHTFTCGSGPTNRLCGPGEEDSNRFWRKTLRDNNADGIYGNAGDGVDPTATTPPSAASTRRARPTTRTARRTAARTRCRNRRTWRSTGCCARSTSSPTSTTTRPASSC